MTRTVTRAGRVGTPSERKSRTAPARRQYGQASVPVARTERTVRRSSRAPATLSERIGSAPSER